MKKSDFSKEEWVEHCKEAIENNMTSTEYLRKITRDIRNLEDDLLEAQFGDIYDGYGNRYKLNPNDTAGHRG